MSGHRWSGWPGAWCLDCGCEQNLESALSCSNCITPCCPMDFETILCPDHLKTQEPEDCPEPGSKRNDPYARLK